MSERCHEIPAGSARKFRITCPKCSTSFLVDKPEALVWERCPACRLHVWDTEDALMADRVTAGDRCSADTGASAIN